MKFRKIYIELSDICGLKCSFCPTPKGVRGIMNLAEFSRILDEISPYTRLIALHILGDPLRLRNIGEYLACAKNKNLSVEITTSGVYLRDFELLLSPPIRQINISLDAIMELESAANRHLERVFEFCHFRQNSMSETFINLRIQNLPQNTALKEKIEREFGVKIMSEKTRIGTKTIVVLTNHFEWGDSTTITNQGSCYGLIEHIGILSNGVVVPCCIDVCGEIALGNLADSTLGEILQSARALEILRGFKKNILVEEKCQKCDYRRRNIAKR